MRPRPLSLSTCAAGPTAYLEFDEKTVLGLKEGRHRLKDVRTDRSLQLVIEVPSCEAYAKQNPRVEPTSLIFQPYQSSSRHGDWLPRINVPIRCGPERVNKLRLQPSIAEKTPSPTHDKDGQLSVRGGSDDAHTPSPKQGMLGNPYASPCSPTEASVSSRAALASERRLSASNKRLSTSRLLISEKGDLKLPNYGGNTARSSMASARSQQSSCSSVLALSKGGGGMSERGFSPTRDRSPPRDTFWPREFATNEMYAERLRESSDKRKKEREAKEKLKPKPEPEPDNDFSQHSYNRGMGSFGGGDMRRSYVGGDLNESMNSGYPGSPGGYPSYPGSPGMMGSSFSAASFRKPGMTGFGSVMDRLQSMNLNQ